MSKLDYKMRQILLVKLSSVCILCNIVRVLIAMLFYKQLCK